MKRFTARDWAIINAAMALYECDMEDHELTDGEMNAIQRARAKVQERLTQEDTDGWQH